MQIAAKDRIGVGGIGEWANGREGVRACGRSDIKK
jgi:hypothetical protein